MGTPEFAVAALEKLHQKGHNIVCVITSVDKAAGRGKKIRQSAVKEYALKHKLKILQPKSLKDSVFVDEIKELKPDLQIVVAFRMLPKTIWEIPKLGTINLHASLLPQYRGAAPINHAIINGEKETGLTTFFINEAIDTGNILLQEKILISEMDTLGSLHDKMMMIGGELICKTINGIVKKAITSQKQIDLIANQVTLHSAPKIFKQDCQIDWNKPQNEVFNFIRGLSPYPGAYTYIYSATGEKLQLKIFEVEKTAILSTKTTNIETDNKSFICINSSDFQVKIKILQLEGRKKMDVKSFLLGMKNIDTWKVFQN
jgi:methionyl-tRNA formyltransferase